LELILEDELAVRDQRQIERRVKAAQFREVKPLDQFDWSFNPAFPKKRIFELATWRRCRRVLRWGLGCRRRCRRVLRVGVWGVSFPGRRGVQGR
jgi:hypothetical protein